MNYEEYCNSEVLLGKIIKAKYGIDPDYPNLIGLQLEFKLDGCVVKDGYKYMSDFNDDRTFIYKNEIIQNILRDANVKNISELVGKPVQVTLVDNLFDSFRILTEVLWYI